MKVCEIDHANISCAGDQSDVVISVELDENDQKKIHEYHISHGERDYDSADISMLFYVMVGTDTEGNKKVKGNLYAAYYPAEQGEHEYNTKIAPEVCEEAYRLIEKEYIGNESRYDL